MSTPPNALYYGDNLGILRGLAPATVDLVYLDPPFNSNRAYSLLYKEKSGQDSAAQLEAFTDTWSWDRAAAGTFDDLRRGAPGNVRKIINALHDFLGTNDMLAYLVMMTARLVELHRVLKPTGSLYLHCDTTASHYLKLVLDAIFGPLNYRNEIIWKRTSAHNDPKRFGRIHDVLLYYAKDVRQVLFNPVYVDYDAAYLAAEWRTDPTTSRRYKVENLTAPSHGHQSGRFEFHGRVPGASRMWRFTVDEMERLWQAGRIKTDAAGIPLLRGLIEYLDERKGMPVQDLWDDVLRVGNTAKERLGYPTQKPLALLERIIQASSNPGDLVLDPFCGCGTAVIAAQQLGRRWIGIDITHLSIALMRKRLLDTFGPSVSATYRVVGEPEDLESARALALESAHDGRYQFQWWAIAQLQALPEGGDGGRTGKKGADRGIDGRIPFVEADGTLREAIISVKSGHVTAPMIRELEAVVRREPYGVIGVLLTLDPPTSVMRTEAAGMGFYDSAWTGQRYPRMQIITVAELLQGKRADLPPSAPPPGATAPRAPRTDVSQGTLDLESR